MIWGYARVSTVSQTMEGQVAALKEAGAACVIEETGSGGDRERPELRKLLRRIQKGDILIVVRIDRLARSVAHLLEVIETLEKAGAGFRSLGDPVDTTTAQGKFTLQILGAVAELERALIRERTIAGLDVARRHGRVGGNPKLKSRDPAALQAAARARDDQFFEQINSIATEWVPIVKRTRPTASWSAVADAINRQSPAPLRPWTPTRVQRAAKRFVLDGLLDVSIMGSAPKSQRTDRQVAIVAAMVNADPAITLRRIAEALEHMRERPPRGEASWALSSVRMLRNRAKRLGMISDTTSPGMAIGG